MKRKVRSGVVPSPINMEEYLKEDEDLAQMLLEFDSDDDVDLASSQQEIEDIQKNLEAKEKRKKITQKYEKQQETFESILDVEDGRAKVIHEAMQNFSTSLQITLPASHEILGEPTLYFTKPCLNDFNLEFEPSELTDRRVSKLTSLVNQLVDGSDPKLEQKIMKSMQKKSVYESNPECLSPQLIQSLLTIVICSRGYSLLKKASNLLTSILTGSRTYSIMDCSTCPSLNEMHHISAQLVKTNIWTPRISDLTNAFQFYGSREIGSGTKIKRSESGHSFNSDGCWWISNYQNILNLSRICLGIYRDRYTNSEIMELLKHLFAAKADSFTNAKFSYALTESIELILSLFERELMTNQNREIIPLISSVVLDLQVTAYIPHQIDILLRLPKSELCRKVSKLCCFRLLQSLTQTSSHLEDDASACSIMDFLNRVLVDCCYSLVKGKKQFFHIDFYLMSSIIRLTHLACASSIDILSNMEYYQSTILSTLKSIKSSVSAHSHEDDAQSTVDVISRLIYQASIFSRIRNINSQKQILQ